MYNDLCHTLTSESGTDKILKDRQNDFVNNNLSICEEDCELTQFDNDIKMASCSCPTKINLPLISDIKVDKNKLFSNFKNIKNIGNFKMLKCIHLFFDKNNIFKNTSNYMLIILLILSIIAMIIFYYYNKNKIKEYIVIDNEKTEKKTKHKKKKHKTNINNNLILNESRNAQSNNNNKIKRSKKKKSRTERNHVISINKNINNKQNNKFGIKNNNKESLEKFKGNIIDSKTLNFKKETSKSLEITKPYNDIEMNSLNYEQAILEDKWEYYLSLLKTRHILIFTFFQYRDYNSQIIKIYIFFFTFAINYIVSAMFYSDSTMHQIYEEEGSFNFTYQLPQMFYSLIISTILKMLLNILGLYEKNIIAIKNITNNGKGIKKEFNKIKCKIIFFFVITYILLFSFWIYLGCFCAVYKNTQKHHCY